VLNGGIYIKLAQQLANMGHGIPREYAAVLSAMQDHAPPLAFDKVLPQLRHEFGLPSTATTLPDGTCVGGLEALFQHISPTPLASASIAQVHRAVTADGAPVAVKLQYGFLRDIMEIDLSTVEFCTQLAEMAFPRLDLQWLLEEMRHSLQKEMDFVHEGQTSERIAALLSRQDLHIPKVRWDLTSPRIITTEFINGLPIAQTAQLASAGLDPLDVAHTFVSVFSEMIFRLGFVHCDPHPGNALVQPRGAAIVSVKSRLEPLPGVALDAGDVPDLARGTAYEVIETVTQLDPAVYPHRRDSALRYYSTQLAHAAAVGVLLPVRLTLAAAALAVEGVRRPLQYVGLLASAPSAPAVRSLAAENIGKHNHKYTSKHVSTYARYDAEAHCLVCTTVVTPRTGGAPTVIAPATHLYTFEEAVDKGTFAASALAGQSPHQRHPLYLRSLLHYLLYPLLAPIPASSLSAWLAPPSASASAPLPASATLRLPQRVVLLDHGLYRQFSAAFSRSFSQLFRAFFARDDAAVERLGLEIGMGHYWKLLPLIFAHRLPNSSKRVGDRNFSQEEMAQFRRDFGGMDIADMISSLPADLAFVMKTMNLLRSVSAQLQYPLASRLLDMFMLAVGGAHTRALAPAYADEDGWARVLAWAPHARAGSELGVGAVAMLKDGDGVTAGSAVKDESKMDVTWRSLRESLDTMVSAITGAAVSTSSTTAATPKKQAEVGSDYAFRAEEKEALSRHVDGTFGPSARNSGHDLPPQSWAPWSTSQTPMARLLRDSEGSGNGDSGYNYTRVSEHSIARTRRTDPQQKSMFDRPQVEMMMNDPEFHTRHASELPNLVRLDLRTPPKQTWGEWFSVKSDLAWLRVGYFIYENFIAPKGSIDAIG
jgi:predicted unusual protein kinase regulating ubiquinone biosynthesis (AarF/ABC1/UbiB family)